MCLRILGKFKVGDSAFKVFKVRQLSDKRTLHFIWQGDRDKPVPVGRWLNEKKFRDYGISYDEVSTGRRYGNGAGTYKLGFHSLVSKRIAAKMAKSLRREECCDYAVHKVKLREVIAIGHQNLRGTSHRTRGSQCVVSREMFVCKGEV